jgi:hypothetical protein
VPATLTEGLATLMVMAGVTLAAACGGPDASLTRRLETPGPLSQEEIARTLDGVGRAMAGRSPRVRQGAVTRPLDEKERAQVFDVLADPRGLEDAGIQHIGDATVRGLRAPATSPQSEIEATGTVWLDIKTLLPRRYDFVYAMPGFGDVTLDLTF